jgi:hypothetical protein
VDQPAAGDGQPEAVTEQVRDAAEGEAGLFVEDHRQGHRLRAELHGGGAQRIGRLQRVSALDAAVLTVRTSSNPEARRSTSSVLCCLVKAGSSAARG